MSDGPVEIPVRRVPTRPQPAEPIDLLALAGGSLARRSLPGIAIAAIAAAAAPRRPPVRWAIAAVGAGAVAGLEWWARRDDRL
ncbi:MAG: hypothetical protein ACLGI2_17250 [Acidimicrobiia bacterium]